MIDLAGLAALVEEHRGELTAPTTRFDVTGAPPDGPTIMGVVNLSRDSWYRESVAATTDAAIRRGRVLAAQGAHVVDVGAESVVAESERVSAEVQSARLVPVVEGLVADGVTVSVESYHPSTVEATLGAGARVLNLTGSGHDAEMFDLAAAHDTAVVLCHIAGDHARDLSAEQIPDDPLPAMLDSFEQRIAVAREHGVRQVAVDPGIGFGLPGLDEPLDRARYQAKALLHSFRLRHLAPVCQALPSAMDIFGEEVRSGEGFFAVLASLGMVDVLRTHEVPLVRAVVEAMATFDVGP